MSDSPERIMYVPHTIEVSPDLAEKLKRLEAEEARLRSGETTQQPLESGEPTRDPN